MTDWLARRVRGVIDFRLPGDPPDIPSRVFAARIEEYLQQVRRRPGSTKAPHNPPPFPSRPTAKPQQNQAAADSRPTIPQPDKSPTQPQQTSLL